MALTDKGKKWRGSLIRKAKTIQNQVLLMPDDDYQTMLEDRYDKSSTADLSINELKDLCTHLDTLAGGSPTPGQQKAPRVDPQARKIWMLWQELHKTGEVRDPSTGALNSFIRSRCRITVESYTWLNRYQASDVIEILKKWLKRVEKNQTANG